VDVANAPERLRALPSWLLGQLTIEARRVTGEVLAEHGVHRSQYALLASLEQFGTSNQSQLSERTGLDRSDVVRWVDQLHEGGFVKRRPDQLDRRRNAVSITALGIRQLSRLDFELGEAQDKLLAALLPNERKDLVRLLRRALGAG
jgi:MarR family transcriptional regulator, lower aerobic nicotinate degradation pathway regulator